MTLNTHRKEKENASLLHISFLLIRH